MPGMAVSNHVIVRNNFGQFIRECEAAGTKTVQDAVKKGAKLSRALAPIGVKPDPRTPSLRASIEPVMFDERHGAWYADARHALPIEYGAAPHLITGNVTFFWEEEGRDWTPGDNWIQHPGNDAQPYLRPAYEIVMRTIMEEARRNYPS